MTIHQTFLRGFGRKFPPSGSLVWQLGDVAVLPGTAFCSLTWNTDGSISLTGIISAGPSSWLAPNAAGSGTPFWLRATETASNSIGTFTGPTGYVQLSSARTFSLELSSGPQTGSRTYTFELATDSGGTHVVRTYTGVTFQAITEI